MRQLKVIIQIEPGRVRKKNQAQIVNNNPGLGQRTFCQCKFTMRKISQFVHFCQRIRSQVQKGDRGQYDHNCDNVLQARFIPFPAEILKKIPFVKIDNQRQCGGVLLAAQRQNARQTTPQKPEITNPQVFSLGGLFAAFAAALRRLESGASALGIK